MPVCGVTLHRSLKDSLCPASPHTHIRSTHTHTSWCVTCVPQDSSRGPPGAVSVSEGHVSHSSFASGEGIVESGPYRGSSNVQSTQLKCSPKRMLGHLFKAGVFNPGPQGPYVTLTYRRADPEDPHLNTPGLKHLLLLNISLLTCCVSPSLS